MRHCTQEKCNVVGAMGISGMGGVEHETLSACVIWLTKAFQSQELIVTSQNMMTCLQPINSPGPNFAINSHSVLGITSLAFPCMLSG